MLRKVRLLFPEIRIIVKGCRTEAFLNGRQVFFDFECDGSQPVALKNAFLSELIRLKRTYLKYTLVKPKLVIDLTRADAQDKMVLKEAMEKAMKRFDHVLAGFIDGKKKMIL
ncbi:MAG: hypothetical protein ACM3OC_04235 [Deltaproteobacteria bacterium]